MTKASVLKLHLDTDLGGDIDDLCALAMVLNWPDVDLIAVTTVADDKGKRAGYVRCALELAGRENVAVASGADVSLGCYRDKQGFPDENRYWAEPIPPAPTTTDQALSLLESSIKQGAIIAAIGPFTNLALLEGRTPGILATANLYLMGGYVFPPRHGFPNWDSTMDYNVQVDVQSARFVLQSSAPTLVPLSMTVETSLRRAYLSALMHAGPLAQLIARQAEAFAADENYENLYGQTCEGLPFDTINFHHDPLACAIALGWRDGVEIRDVSLTTEIKNSWLYQRIDDGGKRTKVVTRVNASRFNELWLERVIAR